MFNFKSPKGIKGLSEMELGRNYMNSLSVFFTYKSNIILTQPRLDEYYDRDWEWR